MATRIISRAEGGLVREPPADRAKVVRPTPWLLTHYTGGDETTTDGKSDRQHMAELANYARNAGKEWEYNYVITAPNGDIWEMAGVYKGAHCANFNEQSLAVQMNLGVNAAPNQAMIDSHRWLREELVRTGQWTGAQNVPHYRFRATACPGLMMAEPAGPQWNSPTGEGSLGNLLPFMTAPFTPQGEKPMAAIVKSTSGIYWYSTGTLIKRLETAREQNLMRLLIGRSGGNAADYEGITEAEIAAGYMGYPIDTLYQKVLNIEAVAGQVKAAADAAKVAADAAKVAAVAAAQNSADARAAAIAANNAAEAARVAAQGALDAVNALEPGLPGEPTRYSIVLRGSAEPTTEPPA